MDEKTQAPTDRPQLQRSYEPWTETESEQLVGELRAGLAFADLAATHGRTASALQTHAARMVPADLAGTSRARRLDWLREQLAADADYDWRTPLRARRDVAVWLDADDERLRAGWDLRTPLPELAQALERSEQLVLRRFLTLRLASTTAEVVDRLGCSPGGTVETNLLIATDAARARLHVLLGTSDDLPAPVHLSLHSTLRSAAERADAVDRARAGRGHPPLRWSTIERQVDPVSGEHDPRPLDAEDAPAPG